MARSNRWTPVVQSFPEVRLNQRARLDQLSREVPEYQAPLELPGSPEVRPGPEVLGHLVVLGALVDPEDQPVPEALASQLDQDPLGARRDQRGRLLREILPVR